MPSTNEAGADAGSQTINHGSFRLDLHGFAVSVNGQDVPLTYSEFLLLKELAGNPNRYFDRGALQAVLDARSAEAKDLRYAASGPATARSVDLHISRLRRKLKQCGYDCIRTMRFVGYRFVPAE
jgi:DNA-binding response OmpR family regulator